MISVEVNTRKKESKVGQKNKRGRLTIEEWQLRVRYVLRHLDDPIALQGSPLCRLAALERLAKNSFWGKFSFVVPLGRLERPTHGLGNRCSIHLSYRGIILEPGLTPVGF